MTEHSSLTIWVQLSLVSDILTETNPKMFEVQLCCPDHMTLCIMCPPVTVGIVLDIFALGPPLTVRL